MYQDNLARIIPQAPKSEPKKPKIAKAKKRAEPVLPDPRGHKAKEAISALYPSVTNPNVRECHDPNVAHHADRYHAIGERLKELADDREIHANFLRLEIKGNAGIIAGDYQASWSDVRGSIDYAAILTVIRAAHPEAGETIDQCLAQANAHVGTNPSTYRAKGHRAIKVQRGAE